jgi:hypothetical protein
VHPPLTLSLPWPRSTAARSTCDASTYRTRYTPATRRSQADSHGGPSLTRRAVGCGRLVAAAQPWPPSPFLMSDCRKEPDVLSSFGAGMAASSVVSISTTSAAPGRRTGDSSQQATITWGDWGDRERGSSAQARAARSARGAGRGARGAAREDGVVCGYGIWCMVHGEPRRRARGRS